MNKTYEDFGSIGRGSGDETNKELCRRRSDNQFRTKIFMDDISYYLPREHKGEYAAHSDLPFQTNS